MPPYVDPHKIHGKHYVLHGCTFLLTVLVGVILDLAILQALRNEKQTVYWKDGEVEFNYQAPTNAPATNGGFVEFGVRKDGVVVWRFPK